MVNAATTARRCATASFVNTCIVFHCITRGSAAECRLVFIEPSCSLQQLLSVSNISRHVAALDTKHASCPASNLSPLLRTIYKYSSLHGNPWDTQYSRWKARAARKLCWGLKLRAVPTIEMWASLVLGEQFPAWGTRAHPLKLGKIGPPCFFILFIFFAATLFMWLVTASEGVALWWPRQWC